MIFFYCLLLYSIFSIRFSQEEQIHDFLHLLRIGTLIFLMCALIHKVCVFLYTKSACAITESL